MHTNKLRVGGSVGDRIAEEHFPKIEKFEPSIPKSEKGRIFEAAQHKGVSKSPPGMVSAFEITAVKIHKGGSDEP